MNNIYLLEWTEYESGWGTRPDGVQIFVNSDNLAKVVAEDTAKRIAATETPLEYSIPEDKIAAQVSDADFKKISDRIGDRPFMWSNEVGKNSFEGCVNEYPSLTVVATERM